MTKKKRKKGLNLHYTVYTEEVFDLSYPKATEEEKFHFFMKTDEEKLAEMEVQLGTTVNKVTRVVLDEEYLEWIEENNLPNNAEIRSSYARETDRAKAEILWKKNKMDKEIFHFLSSESRGLRLQNAQAFKSRGELTKKEKIRTKPLV